MGLDDKIKNAADKLVGGAKEKFGAATDNAELEAEGQGQKLQGKVGDGIEDVKDTFK